MKDYKSILLIFVSLLLLTVSLALLWTWGYNYGKKKNSPPTSVGVDSMGNKILTKDSLNQLYINALNNINTLDLALSKADSLKLDITFKLSELDIID
jgi:vancomycin permeability regulator SanA